MNHSVDLMTRRQALVRVACLLGGTLSASTVAGVLGGCEASPITAEGTAQLLRTLSPEQSEMVLAMGEHILPETDTPGARTARVDRFIDAMLTDYSPAKTRQRFLAGLERVDARARQVFGNSFLAVSPEQQLQLVQTLNRAAFGEREEPQEEPAFEEGDVARGARPMLDDSWDKEDVGRDSFFRMLKELVLVGYYTSEVGATEELRVNPMGSWRADIPYDEVGRSWS